ncbi:pyruvate ferredoxin oxidoreductase [Ectothiorhodospiraceae bacterium BW-2]|nr:pyruvate ferredoxin oxidoreductase [Ectothiorhodospiraceae bacterium BW-2]
MIKALEGSQALAEAVALCRPQVIAAYPITPQTHIVENLAKLVANDKLQCEYVSVESEFSAASVALGAVAAGSRAYTASASQGILLMSEVLFNIAGMRIPLVMTCANRAVSAPLSIWNDQQDSMAVRDAGWIQLYCGDNQEAVDTTIQAYKIAEECELPVMVCVDGFTLTHTLEAIDIPSVEQVDLFLPPFQFSRTLTSQQPMSAGALVAPDIYSEARYSHHQALLKAAEVIERVDNEWQTATGRGYGGLVKVELNPDGETGLLVLGSATGTFYDAIVEQALDEVRLIRLRSFRPFPIAALKEACAGLKRLIVVERALSLGSGGIVTAELRAALAGSAAMPLIHSFAIGLGGRDIPISTVADLLARVEGATEPVAFEIFAIDSDKLSPEDQ